MKLNINEMLLHLRNLNIHTIEEYSKLYKNRPDLDLPENPFREHPSFRWYDTWWPGQCPYYSRSECINALKELLMEIDDPDEIYDLCELLCEKDGAIPCNNLVLFYGGKYSDYGIY